MAIAGGFLGHPGGAVAGLLYSQPWDGSNTAYLSQNDTTTGSSGLGNFATAYDNFRLASPGVVNSVTWAGQYLTPGSDVISAFTLSFYNDSAGLPGGLISSDVISGNAGESILGVNAGITTYSYSADISGNPFSSAAATPYWLSIVPDLANTTQWGWSAGTGGDGSSYQIFFGAGNSQPNDLAFALSGTSRATATPEPGSLTLLGLGLASMGMLGWIKKRKTNNVAA